MHEHDLDLIAALAEGSLEDEGFARALVDECEVCRAEYRSHSEVLAWITSTPRVEMNDVERAALHRDLWTELTRAPARAAATPWWQRWSYVAAGLFVAVGLVAVLNGEFGGGESAEPTLAGAADSADSAAGEEMAPFAEDNGADGASDRGGVTTTAEAVPLPFPELAEQARAARQTDAEASTMGTDEATEDCLTGLGLDNHVVVDQVEEDQTYLVLMAEEAEADRSVTFVALDDCEIAYVDR